MLQVAALSRVFDGSGRTVVALDQVDLDVAKGEFITIIGTSGCGKTTLLRAIAGLDTDYTGSALLAGVPIRRPGLDRGMVFQDHRLLPWLTVRDNVGFGLARQTAAERTEVIDHHLRLVGLQGFESALPGELSGGMAQRAAIARALVNRPQILLLDEPLGALDALTRMRMQKELERIWQQEGGLTCIMVTHDVDEAVYLSDRIVIMSARPGKIKRIVPVPLARPRDRDSHDFIAIKDTLLEEFEQQAERYFSYTI